MGARARDSIFRAASRVFAHRGGQSIAFFVRIVVVAGAENCFVSTKVRCATMCLCVLEYRQITSS
jgi:hypothetical protein